MALEYNTTIIPGVVIIRPKVYGDNLSYLCETIKAPDSAAVGMPVSFVQDNESSSIKRVLRGLRFQKKHTQRKLVRVTHGEVFNIVVDVSFGTSTYGWAVSCYQLLK